MDKRIKTEPAKETKAEIKEILNDFGKHIEEVEKYIQTSFTDTEIFATLQKEEEEKIKDLQSIKIKSLDFPLDLNLDHYFDTFYHSGVLKSFESRAVQEYFPNVFFSKRAKKMCRLLFLIVFVLKFPDTVECDSKNLLQTVRKKFSSCYVKIFSKLPKLKEELINILIFSICYITHMLFYLLFPKNQSLFKIRFILDVYHIALFELNGVYVSDYYLQNNFEKLFTSKFLEYEQQEKKNNKKNLIHSNKNEKAFLGRKVTYPVIFNHEGGMDFADELINRLKIHKRSPRRYGVATTIANENNNKNEKHKIHDFEDAVNIADNKLNQEEAKKINETIAGHILHSQELQEKEEMKRKVLVAMNDKKKFNCIQISPTFSQVLNIKNMNLPFKKKKMINHSIDKLYTQNKDYREIFEEIYNQRKHTKEHKTNIRPKSISQKSILKNYGDIKVEYDEKAKKYPKLFRDMEDLYEILNKYNDKFSNLASSKQTLEDYKKHNVLKFDDLKKEAEEEMKKRLNTYETQKNLIEKEKANLIEELVKDEAENHSKSREPVKNQDYIEEDESSVKDPRKTISTLFKLPILANKFLQNTSVGKKNLTRTRTKNLSESTVASLLKNEEDYAENFFDQPRRKINLNAVIEEGGKIKHLSDEDDKGSNEDDNKNMFIDKRREYQVKYSKIIRGNHDENIDEIINKIMVKQNMLSKKLITGFKSKKTIGNKKAGRIKLNL